MKYEAHCCECGTRILLEENEIDSSYDHLCKECAKQYIMNIDEDTKIRFARRTGKAQKIYVQGAYSSTEDYSKVGRDINDRTNH